MKFIKALSIILFFTLLFFSIFEAFSRTVIFLITKNKVIFEYGFNKTILFKVKDLSKLDFILISKKKENIKNKQKLLNSSKKKLTIWAFGGSTTEGSTPRCGHDTSSWVYELSKLNENILTVNFGSAGNNTNGAVNALHEETAKKEFKHTVGFNSHVKKLKYFHLYDFHKGKPDIILWAGKVNEQTNYSHLNINFFKENSKKFLQRLDYTLKTNSLFYFLFNDVLERSGSKIFGNKFNINHKKFDEKSAGTKKFEISSQIYKNNTTKAIQFAKNFDIDFHIISLFGKYYGYSYLPLLWQHYNPADHSFYNLPFYDYWFKTAEELSKKYNVYYFKTEDLAFEVFKKKDFKKGLVNKDVFFCDTIHQTLLGNVLTAEIINDYLIKTYDLE